MDEPTPFQTAKSAIATAIVGVAWGGLIFCVFLLTFQYHGSLKTSTNGVNEAYAASEYTGYLIAHFIIAYAVVQLATPHITKKKITIRRA